jgi:hypothetical protein
MEGEKDSSMAAETGRNDRGNAHAAQVMCALCLLFFLLLLWEVVCHRRRTLRVREDYTPGENNHHRTGSVGGLLTYGMRNWKSMQDMLRWKAEVSTLDAVMCDISAMDPSVG